MYNGSSQSTLILVESTFCNPHVWFESRASRNKTHILKRGVNTKDPNSNKTQGGFCSLFRVEELSSPVVVVVVDPGLYSLARWSWWLWRLVAVSLTSLLSFTVGVFFFWHSVTHTETPSNTSCRGIKKKTPTETEKGLKKGSVNKINNSLYLTLLSCKKGHNYVFRLKS